MKKILYDLLLSQPSGTSKFHGGGEYMKRIFRELVLTKPDDVELVSYYNHDAFLDEWLLELMKTYGIRSYNIKSIEEIHSIFEQEHFDVFYSGMAYDYRKEYFPDDIYKIGTFHGMRGAECPHDRFEYKYIGSFVRRTKEQIRNLIKDTSLGYERSRKSALQNYEKCIKCFDKLICDSMHTSYSLLAYYPLLENISVNVCYPPLKYSGTEGFKELENNKFILLLGGDRWIKNAYRGVKAIDSLYSRGHLQGIKTVIVGGLSSAILKEIKNKERFDIKGYVDDEELNSLYNNCSVFLYPTLNEGFGYPPLEAMRYGKTCIVSAVCSLPEICGDAVYYINPYDIGEIQNRILWAVDQQIDKDKVLDQYNKVLNRQTDDLKRICGIILRQDNDLGM